MTESQIHSIIFNMESLKNDYFNKEWLEAPLHQRMLVFEFGKFAVDVGLKDFQENDNRPESDHIVGLDSETFREKVEAIGEPLAVGAVGHLQYNSDEHTFDAKVIYDKDFFSSQSSKEDETFEDILPTAVEFEFRKLSTLLTYLSHTPGKNKAELTGEDLHSDTYRSLESALAKGTFAKFVEYLGVKLDAEYPEEVGVKNRMNPPTKRDDVIDAYCELLVHQGYTDDEIEYASRNF